MKDLENYAWDTCFIFLFLCAKTVLLCTCFCHKNMMLLYFDYNMLEDHNKTFLYDIDCLNKCVNQICYTYWHQNVF